MADLEDSLTLNSDQELKQPPPWLLLDKNLMEELLDLISLNPAEEAVAEEEAEEASETEEEEAVDSAEAEASAIEEAAEVASAVAEEAAEASETEVAVEVASVEEVAAEVHLDLRELAQCCEEG